MAKPKCPSVSLSKEALMKNCLNYVQQLGTFICAGLGRYLSWHSAWLCKNEDLSSTLRPR